jgi:outer membrane immunogenic protein
VDATNIGGKTTCYTSTCETHLSSLGDLSLRAGISQDRALFYLKGGVAYEDATHHIEGPDYDHHDDGGAVFGYLIGGGVEYALLYNITTKLEYNYMDFGSNGYNLNYNGPDTHISVKESINVVKLGFNFKFD